MQFDFFTPFVDLTKSKSKKNNSIANNSKDVKLFVAYLEGKKTLSDFNEFILKTKKKKYRYNHVINYLSTAIDHIEDLLTKEDAKSNIDLFSCHYDNAGNLKKGWLTQKGNDLINYLKFNFYHYNLPIIEDNFDYFKFNSKDFDTKSVKKLNYQINKKYVAFLEYYWGQTDLKAIDEIAFDIKSYIYEFDKETIEELQYIFDELVREFYNSIATKMKNKKNISKSKDDHFILTNIYVKNKFMMTKHEKQLTNSLLKIFKDLKEKNEFNYKKIFLFLRWCENVILNKVISMSKTIHLNFGEVYFLVDNIFNQALHILAYVYFYHYKKNKLS